MREARVAAGKTQEEIASRCAVGQSAVAHWERGAYLPGLANLGRFARACGIDASDLLEAAAR